MNKMNIKLFADGEDKEGIMEMYENPIIDGFTTNPTLMKLAGIKDYIEFAQFLSQLYPIRLFPNLQRRLTLMDIQDSHNQKGILPNTNFLNYENHIQTDLLIVEKIFH